MRMILDALTMILATITILAYAAAWFVIVPSQVPHASSWQSDGCDLASERTARCGQYVVMMESKR